MGEPGSRGPMAPAPLNCACLLGFLLNPKFPEKVEGRFTAAPLVDLSLSPPSGLDSPNGSSSLSPERQGNGDLPTVPTAPVRRGCRFWKGTVYWFPGTTITKDHHLGGLKQHKCIVFSLFWKLSSKIKVSTELVPSEGSREESCLFQLLVAPGDPCFVAMSLQSASIITQPFPLCVCVQTSFFLL